MVQCIWFLKFTIDCVLIMQVCFADDISFNKNAAQSYTNTGTDYEAGYVVDRCMKTKPIGQHSLDRSYSGKWILGG